MTEALLTILTVLGGVGLFLFGMELVTRGLREALGSRLRMLLQRVTTNRFVGLVGGAATASVLFSGPTTVMIVGFVNAGLMTLVQAIPMILGANVGTTVALQIVAFNVGVYSPIIIAIGMASRLFSRSETFRNVGQAILGFGLLFLGLTVMQQALEPVKESDILSALLASIGTGGFGSVLFGVLVSVVLTATIMSSGAMIALLFALAGVGLITDFSQAFPILLGAHIGTCIIALIGSIGTTRSARRAALAHLVFNIGGTILALILIKAHLTLIPMTSENLVRQIANGHTLIQLVNALAFLALVHPMTALLERIVPRQGKEQEISHLDPDLVETPELAILMIVKEMRRQAQICERMLRTSMEAMLSLDLSRFEEVRKDEQAVDTIKHALDEYIVMVGERQLSHRQSLLLQHLTASSNDLERIADHIETIGILTRTKVRRKIWFNDESMLQLVELGKFVSRLLSLTVDSLDPTQPEYRDLAMKVLDMRKEYKTRARFIKEEFNNRAFEGAEDALTGMFFMRYITVFDRIIRHIRGIARHELKESFRIKEYKLTRVVPKQRPTRLMPADGSKIDETALFQESQRDKE